MTGGELFPLVVNDTGKPLGNAVGTTLAHVWQGVVGDRVAAWRIRNAAALNEKLRTEIAATGTSLNLEKVPEGIAFTWFEKATQADEPEIQDLFAKLLANAAAGNDDALRKRNIELVSSLAPEDARLLAFVAERFAEYEKTRRTAYSHFEMTVDFMFSRHYKEAGFTNDLPIDTLTSLGILRFDRDFKMGELQMAQRLSALGKREEASWLNLDLAHVFEFEDKLVLTDLGKSLILALFPQLAAPQQDN